MQERGSSSLPGNIKELGISPSAGGPRNGLGFAMTTFFLVAQMAGAGFLSLPKAVANCGWVINDASYSLVVDLNYYHSPPCRLGWIGLVMMVVFCTGVGFSGTRLGACWVILEERWPMCYRDSCRQPYMEIADRALGIHGRRLALACVLITLVGGTTVFLILIASFMKVLVTSVSICEWVLITAALVMPFTWLGTPKDFWQASVLAVTTTTIACVVILVEIILEKDLHPNPVYQNPTVSSFALGFGAILFAFGGASVFPTIQNDMGNRKLFIKAVVVAFAEFGWKRCVLRSAILIFEVVVGLAVPDFGKILNLIGGSTVTLCSFILPPLMYMKLVDDKSNPSWPQRQIELWERMLLWIIVGVGVVGGIASTISALIAILSPDSFSTSCFSDFYF
ncbi:Amino acid transporter AVT1C-like 1 [Homarus americanus]|uniref:Amino acid transporter AVT1C-like 1 n=1 Tax=Homarus americanus TaxID=6706 RepID=A0A8J5T7V9_HOMAM|nr:Amino acid transporter AVT1C-like 1 [Homarus americanus]